MNFDDMKKQTKPEVFLDQYLGTIGLWRKPIARDGLSLFRAVSEQLFMTQVYHNNLYEACRIVFFHLGKDPEKDWNEFEVMKILSRMYRKDFLIYESVGQSPTRGTFNNFEAKILLCRVSENQLDSVYKISFQQNAAICQSIVYEVLYRNVFKLNTELTEAVSLIRDQNKHKISMHTNRFEGMEDECIQKIHNLQLAFKEPHHRKPSPPVPYRIAKALDPSIYRNVELDIWEEERRELKKESPEYRKRFSPGDKCQVILEGAHYHGHIQEINDNTALVFIQELGEKKSVLISSLKTPHSTRYRCPSTSRYIQHKQDSPISREELVSRGYYGNQAVSFPGNTARIKPCSVLPPPNYKYSPGYIFPGDFGHKVEQSQMLTGGLMEQYGQLPMHPHWQELGGYQAYSGPLVANTNQTYSCVCIPHLDSISVKDVNINCQPSQDTSGKDLPELNTLRFFFNLGVENYRLFSQGGSNWSTVEMSNAGYMSPGSMLMADQMNGNHPATYALPPARSQNQLADPLSSNHGNHTSIPSSVSQNTNGTTGELDVPDSAISATGKGVTLSTSSHEEMVDSTDSGCDTESTGSHHGDGSLKEVEETAMELEQQLDHYIAIEEEEDVSESSTIKVNETAKAKQKGKQKYYMYGNLKLVKPIKEIPPRYLALLSQLSSERSRCEGEPIIVPCLPPKPYHRTINHAPSTTAHKTNNGCSRFNPQAKSFTPKSPVLHDPSIIACGRNYNAEQSAAMSYPGVCSPPCNMHDNNSQYPMQGTGGGGNQSSFCCSTQYNPSNCNPGDGCKYSMPPCFSTGQGPVCAPYPTSMQYPVIYSTGVPFTGPYGSTAPAPVGVYIQPQNCNLQPKAMPMASMQATQ